MQPSVLAVVLMLVLCERGTGQLPDADPLPRVAGIAFTDSAAAVRTTLGPPDRQQVFLGFTAWDYARRGLVVLWDHDGGALRVLILSRRVAGDVEGVRVGDSVAVATRRWGAPVRKRQAGRFLDFVRRGWATSVEVQRGRIVEITLTVATAGRDTLNAAGHR